MSNHDWQTIRCSRYVRRDECLRCGARRSCEIPDGDWAYIRGGATCKPVIDPNAAERAVIAEGRDG